jgi:transposase
MTSAAIRVIGGVDTHKDAHYASVIDDQGRLIGHQELPATDGGNRDGLGWLRSHGQVLAIGVESSGSSGPTLTRALTKAGEHVIEANRRVSDGVVPGCPRQT